MSLTSSAVSCTSACEKCSALGIFCDCNSSQLKMHTPVQPFSLNLSLEARLAMQQIREPDDLDTTNIGLQNNQTLGAFYAKHKEQMTNPKTGYTVQHSYNVTRNNDINIDEFFEKRRKSKADDLLETIVTNEESEIDLEEKRLEHYARLKSMQKCLLWMRSEVEDVMVEDDKDRISEQFES